MKPKILSLINQYQSDPSKLKVLIEHTFRPSQNAGFMLSKTYASTWLHLLRKHADEVTVSDCLPMIVDRVEFEMDRVVSNNKNINRTLWANEQETLSISLPGFSSWPHLSILNAFNFFQFRLDLPMWYAVFTDLTKLMKLIKCLEEETKALYKCSYGRTRSLINCLNSWSALDRIIHSNQFLWTPYQYLEVKLMIIGYSLRGLQIYTDPQRQPNLLTRAYIRKDHALITAITKCIDQVSDAGLQQIDEISARKLVFLRLAYLFEDKPCNESLPIDAYINEYIMGLRSCYADVSFKRSDKLMAGSDIMADFRRELKSDVRNAVDQFRITVCPAEISHEAIEELIRIVFIEDKQKESYDTLSLKQRLDKLYEQDHIGSSEFSDALVPAKESGGSHRGETKTNSPSIKESESALCRELIVARLKICGSKRLELSRILRGLHQQPPGSMKALESLLQRVKGDFWFYQKGSRLYQCICQSLKEVELCNLVVPTAVKPDSLVGAGMANSSSSLFFKQELAQPFDQLKQHIPYNNL